MPGGAGGSSAACPWDLFGGPRIVKLWWGRGGRICRESWGEPTQGTLVHPRPQMEAHPPRSKGRLPARAVCRVLNARLWSSQKMPVAGPSGSWAGRQGHCPWQALPAHQLSVLVKATFLPTNHYHTVSRPALLPFPHPPSINIQNRSGHLGQPLSHDCPFTQVGGPAARQAALRSWARASPGSDVLNPPPDSLSISPLNPARRTPRSAPLWVCQGMESQW